MANTFWFKHDMNAHDDPKIIALIDSHGIQGYGLYWLFAEMLASAEGNTIDISKSYNIHSIAFKSRMKTEDIKAILHTCTEYDLIIANNGVCSCPALDRRLQSLRLKQDQGRNAANKRWKKEEPTLDFGDVKPKNKKKVLGHKEEHPWLSDDQFKKAFEHFNEMRIKVKKPMTDHAKDLMIQKVNHISKGDIKVSIAILNQSTQSSWTDVYALKEGEIAKQEIKTSFRNDN